MLNAQAIVDACQTFEFGYPLVMAAVWVAGGTFFWWFEERRGPDVDRPPALARYPHVAVLVPCHNEEPYIRETIAALAHQHYPDFEIIAVDDGSTDATGDVLDALAVLYPRLRVLRSRENQGKAAALRAAALITEAEYVICVDADAILHRHGVHWMVSALASGDRVGGVTGNPRIRGRSTALGRMQIGEFSCLVGLIKRTQMIWGRLFTVSGVVCGFRRSALAEVGYWSTDTLTEDVDVSWRLQLQGWQLRFEPRALCWILMPETLGGLWRQRLRWATGALQVFQQCLPRLVHPKSRAMWIVAADYATSILWAMVTVALAALWMVELLPYVSLPVTVGGLVPGAWGLALAIMFLVQILVGMALDRRYERNLWRYVPSVMSYPVMFWSMTLLTVAVGLPRSLLRTRGQAVWVSPDRGVGRT